MIQERGHLTQKWLCATKKKVSAERIGNFRKKSYVAGRCPVFLILHGGVELFQCLFFDAGHIGAGNPKHFGDFLLGQPVAPEKPIAQANDDTLAPCERGTDGGVHFLCADGKCKLVGKIRGIAIDNIQHDDFVSIAVDADWLIKRDIVLRFARESQVHEYLICYPHANASFAAGNRPRIIDKPCVIS